MPSLESLQVFARCCPNINLLEITVDASSPLKSLPLDLPHFRTPLSIAFLHSSKISSASVAHTDMFLAALHGFDIPFGLGVLCDDEAQQ